MIKLITITLTKTPLMQQKSCKVLKFLRFMLVKPTPTFRRWLRRCLLLRRVSLKRQALRRATSAMPTWVWQAVASGAAVARSIATAPRLRVAPKVSVQRNVSSTACVRLPPPTSTPSPTPFNNGNLCVSLRPPGTPTPMTALFLDVTQSFMKVVLVLSPLLPVAQRPNTQQLYNFKRPARMSCSFWRSIKRTSRRLALRP